MTFTRWSGPSAHTRAGLPILVALALAVSACGLVPLNLPTADQVAAGDPLPIDGLWRLESNQVLFQVERGRIIATQGYAAGFARVSAGQVVTTQLRQTGPRDFGGLEMTIKAPWRAALTDDRGLDITIDGPLGAIDLHLDPVTLEHESWLEAQLASVQVVAMPASAAPPKTMSGHNPLAATPPPGARPLAALPAPGTGTGTGTGIGGPVTDPSVFGRYYALVIGNDSYQHLDRLRTARNDARAVADLLRDTYGFETELLLDATREQILMAFSGLRQRLEADDNLLIYYAGHGWLDAAADEGYWLPVDARSDNDVRWIANSTITAHFRAMRAKHVLVVADSCYSGTLTRGIQVTASQRASSDFERLARRKARIVLSSGGEEPVEDGSGQHSAFASAFMGSLRANEGILDTTTLYAQIRRPVMLAADQAPDLADIRKAGHDGGDFLFVRRRD